MSYYANGTAQLLLLTLLKYWRIMKNLAFCVVLASMFVSCAESQSERLERLYFMELEYKANKELKRNDTLELKDRFVNTFMFLSDQDKERYQIYRDSMRIEDRKAFERMQNERETALNYLAD